MRVLKNNDIIQVTCPGCRSELGVEITDVHVNEMCHHGTGQWVCCSQCGTTIDIPFADIPSHWRATLFADD